MLTQGKLGQKPTIKLKHITVSESNYFTLKGLGQAGDSFNQVITGLLNEKGLLKSESRVPIKDQISVPAVMTQRKGQNNYE
jgi:hypothetical protein